jgi:small subunit ribosomal protein S8
MQHDPLNDAITKIRNAIRAGHKECVVRPASRMIASVLKVMQEHGYVSSFELIPDRRGGQFKVKITGYLNDCGVIKPRFSVRVDEIEKYERRYLPAQDFGVLIITTPRGVLSHAEAKSQHVGGRLLAYVY